ncbi:hypothetical protein pkur_cds_833 [Pandoravirus kuranda]|nr:hypothetical protein pkur_cds_833 [Pandoravirus kuranda]
MSTHRCDTPVTASLARATAGDHCARKRKHPTVDSGADATHQHQRRPAACEMRVSPQSCTDDDCICLAPRHSASSATHETLQWLRAALSPIDCDAPLTDARPHASAHTNLVALLRWARAVLYEDDVADDAVGPREGTDAERDHDYVLMRAASRAFGASADEWRSINAAPGRVRDGVPGNEIVARALWTVERLEAGMLAVADARTAAHARLEAVAAIRRLSPRRDGKDAPRHADPCAWRHAVAAVGAAYRSAMRRRLVRIYVAYAPVTAQVDRMRDMGDEAPAGDIPTPRSVRAWFAARDNNDSAITTSDAVDTAASRAHARTGRACKRARLTPPVCVGVSRGATSLPCP